MSVLTPHPTLPAASPTVLWREYRSSGDARLRDRLVFMLAPLVRFASRAGDDAGAEIGMRAVLDAVERYDPERDGPLERYAWARVRAALASRP